MPLVKVNLIMVLLAAIVSMIIGYLWYHPKLFGKRWMELTGNTENSMKNMDTNTKLAYLSSFVAALITAFFLGVFVDLAGAITIATGALVGLAIWTGFVVTVGITNKVFHNQPTELFLINNIYHLVSFVVMGIIVTL